MKPFNLQEALAGKPVVTRDGRKVQRVVHLPELTPWQFKVLAVVDGGMLYVGESGKHCPNDDSPADPADLFMASEKKRGWQCLYRTPLGRIIGGYIHDTEQEAIDQINVSLGLHLATVPVEWEE